MKKMIVTLLSFASPVLVLAHPGHGKENPLSPHHYVGNPEHLLALVLVIAAGVILINWFVYRSRKRTDKR